MELCIILIAISSHHAGFARVESKGDGDTDFVLLTWDARKLTTSASAHLPQDKWRRASTQLHKLRLSTPWFGVIWCALLHTADIWVPSTSTDLGMATPKHTRSRGAQGACIVSVA